MDKNEIKRALKEKEFYFERLVSFDGTPGGVELLMVVKAYEENIVWTVREGSRYTDFCSFEDALDYYVENGGGICGRG